MEFSIKSSSPETVRVPCVVIGVNQGSLVTPAALSLESASDRYLSRLLKQGDLAPQVGKTLLLHNVPGIVAPRVLLVEAGSAESLTERDYRTALRAALGALEAVGVKEALFCLSEWAVDGRETAWKVDQLVLTLREAAYRIPRQSDTQTPPCAVERVLVSAQQGLSSRALGRILAQAQAVANGSDLTRDLANLPPNICTPAYLAETARALAKPWKLGVKVLDRADMEKLGMGALLAVSAGSRQPPKLITLTWNGAGRGSAPVVLVGKGITFDTGGISLKPAAEMDEMKFDMCGAASVIGTMRAVAELKLPLNVIGVVPTCENMPGGEATRPGDIVRSLSGQTIEILNTDAEGRLILCDALTYAARFKPEVMIDVATLTGACVIALGHEAAGLFYNDDELGDALRAAGEESGDRVWPLPLWEEYQEGLKSNFADMANIAGRAGGTITAASFLARFTHEQRWAHLDIAGVAYRGGKEKGATGRPVKLFCRYLLTRCGR